jgi:hypothetical protein
MTPLTFWSARRKHEEDGIAMVIVLGFAAVLTAFIAVGTGIGVNTLKSSQRHVNFEGALAVAEGGIDSTLATINASYNSIPSVDYVSPSPCGITAGAAVFTSDEAERTWARDAILALPSSCTKTAVGGDYIAVRPTDRRAVYAMAWSPNRANPGAKRRLVKAEYLFAPYKPTNAVLTQGSLDFSGSVAVSSLTSAPSDVHSNVDVTGYNGSTSIAGQLSASGVASGGCSSGITGGCVAGSPTQSIPSISARTYYNSASSTDAANWHDLCPGGVMKKPAATPCTGTPELTTNGWDYVAGSGTTPDTWTIPAKAGGPFNGVYYAYQADAIIGGNGNSSTTWQISVLAEAAPTGGTAAHCGKLGGNVTWKLFNMTPSPVTRTPARARVCSLPETRWRSPRAARSSPARSSPRTAALLPGRTRSRV